MKRDKNEILRALLQEFVSSAMHSEIQMTQIENNSNFCRPKIKKSDMSQQFVNSVPTVVFGKKFPFTDEEFASTETLNLSAKFSLHDIVVFTPKLSASARKLM
jgi:hypothetical protein